MNIISNKPPTSQPSSATQSQRQELPEQQTLSKRKVEPSEAEAKQKSGKVWTRPDYPESIKNPTGCANKVANKELLTALTALKKNVTKGNVELYLRSDPRNCPRGKFLAHILDHEGVSLAEIWGTKKGKARTYRFNPGREIDSGEEQQVALALPIARRFVTGKPEAAHADDSAPESGSDTSDDET